MQPCLVCKLLLVLDIALFEEIQVLSEVNLHPIAGSMVGSHIL